MKKEVFWRNQECLGAVPRIVDAFRKQLFYTGNQEFSHLLVHLGIINDYVVELQSQGEDVEEWFLILQGILEGQQNGDYILLADILEADLLPFLQKTQMKLQGDSLMEERNFWKQNIGCIEQADKKLFQQVQTLQKNAYIQYEVLTAINGQITVKAYTGEKVHYMHSMVNPSREAGLLVADLPWSKHHSYLVFGMGLGYHVEAILEANAKNQVTVFEHQIELLQMALTYKDWQKYLLDGRLKIIYEQNSSSFLNCLKQRDEETVLLMHYPSLHCVEQKEVREVLEDFFVSVSSMREQSEYLDENFVYLQERNFEECGAIESLFAGKKVAIIAGGPSVDMELENIKKYRGKMAILAVGTIAKKLLENEISPDAIIITDPQDVMYRQVEGLEVENVPLLLLSTASRTVVS